jgi:alkanesulfonate monooxygenase SsuD/methylene tetrahydromethanopterin reductase-like flavin-dependent oxidoreductase (luciferase family)
LGSPEKVRAEVEAVAVEYGAEEVIVVTITHDHQARRRSYELIADAFGLEPRAVADSPAGLTSRALASPR